MNQETNLIFIFITGLTTGGLTCLALQGSLLASVLTQKETNLKEKLTKQQQLLPILSFLVAKLISYTILGFFLGLLGTFISLTPIIRGWFQIAIAIYLFGIAMSILEIHPIFRYFIITPPKFLSRLVKNNSKNQSLFTPAILGILTIFLPCAVTQAMEIIALGTANPIKAALIMFAFTLGTSPAFFILSFFLTKLNQKFQRTFHYITATFLLIMVVFSLNTALSLMGSIYTFQNFAEVLKNKETNTTIADTTTGQDFQEVTITVLNNGYSPKNITLKKGIKTKLYLITNKVRSCSLAFTIPKLGIQKLLPSTGTTTIEFTPTKTGPLVFSCSMGMYTGTFNVI
jgi:sulfite exporter TauE/SafE